MSKRTILAAAVLMTQVACGDIKQAWEQAGNPQDPNAITADLVIDNLWAEAAFTVTDERFGNVIVPQQRVAGSGSQRFRGVLSGHADEATSLAIDTVAASSYRTFRFDEQVQAGRTLHLAFDFDSVQFAFSLTPSWQDE